MIEYEFWPQREKQDLDVNSINYLLSLLVTNPVNVNPIELDEVSKNSRLLLARTKNEDQVIGMATLVIIVILSGRFGRIEDVVVHDEYRGQGIGKSLIGKLIAEAKSLGLKRIDLNSRPTRIEANKMYQSLGFSLVGTNLYRLKLES